MPSAAAWKKAAKAYRKRYRRESEARRREHEVMRRVGVSVQLAYAGLHPDRDYAIVHVDSTEESPRDFGVQESGMV